MGNADRFDLVIMAVGLSIGIGSLAHDIRQDIKNLGEKIEQQSRIYVEQPAINTDQVQSEFVFVNDKKFL